MTAVYLRKIPGSLIPDGERDAERLKRFKVGDVIKAEVTKPRNYANHKRLFSLLTLIAETSDVYDNVEKALVAVKIASGHVDFLPNPETGELVAVPRSIAYESMDEIQFSEWFESAINAVLAHICPHMNRMAIEQATDLVATW